MTEARRDDSTGEVAESPATTPNKSSKRRPGPTKRGHNGKALRLLNLNQVMEEFGVSQYAVFKAVDEGRLHCGQVDGEGRVYYAEWEVRAFLSLLFELGTAA